LDQGDETKGRNFMIKLMAKRPGNGMWERSVGGVGRGMGGRGPAEGRKREGPKSFGKRGAVKAHQW